MKYNPYTIENEQHTKAELIEAKAEFAKALDSREALHDFGLWFALDNAIDYCDSSLGLDDDLI